MNSKNTLLAVIIMILMIYIIFMTKYAIRWFNFTSCLKGTPNSRGFGLTKVVCCLNKADEWGVKCTNKNNP